MKNIYLSVILALSAVCLAACSTMTTSKESVQNNPATTVTANSPETFGTPAIQDTSAEAIAASDSGIGGTMIGGAVEQAMDEADKTKMLHAMDKAPGKSTHWVNERTNIEYTVTPTKKVYVQDKRYCRQYQMIAINANDKEQSVEGVACIASDGNWHILTS